MTNFKGTKAPWKLKGNDIFDQNGEQLSVAYGEGYGDDYQYTESTYANALLISKAPEMLEMLEQVVKKLKGNGFPMLTSKIEELIKESTEL